MTDYRSIIRLYYDYVIPSYSRTPLVFSRAKGVKVWDVDETEYLDFFPGWAVSGLGHCHKRVVEALRRQADRLIHVSNNYYHEGQGLLAKRIIESSFPGKVFFCNSGAEANEAAFKLVRKFASPQRYEVIAMEGSFHGRTLATVAATGQKKHQAGFEPLPPGFVHVPFNDEEAIRRVTHSQTAAIIVELIQGEGGVHVARPEYVKFLRQHCDRHELLLIFDEVQTGIGRTGRMFCFQNYGVEPDLMTLAKSLGGGFPIGALVAKKRVADFLQPGTHASTFGGNPLAAAASLAVFDAIEKEKLIQNAVLTGSYLFKKLNGLKHQFPDLITEVRGMYLMAGVEVKGDGKRIYEQCLERGLMINCTQNHVLRIMPPLTVKLKEVDKAISILHDVLTSLNRSEGD